MTQLQPHQGYPDLKLQILGQNSQKGTFFSFFAKYMGLFNDINGGNRGNIEVLGDIR